MGDHDSSLEKKLLPASQRSMHSQASIDSCLTDIIRANEEKAQKEEEDQSTIRDVRYRWFVVFLFLWAGAANAIVMLSWSPIFNAAKEYYTNSFGKSAPESSTSTAINLFFTMFQIMYLPGTVAAIYIQGKYGLRNTLLYAGGLTTIGCMLRWATAQAYSSDDQINDSTVNYVIILLGTALSAFVQPIYLNLPTLISLVWFPVDQRDFAMSILSLANTLGSATGSILPSTLVPDSDTIDRKELNKGISDLMLVQVLLPAIALMMCYFYFLNQPRNPPSALAFQYANPQGSLQSKGIEAESASPLVGPEDAEAAKNAAATDKNTAANARGARNSRIQSIGGVGGAVGAGSSAGLSVTEALQSDAAKAEASGGGEPTGTANEREAGEAEFSQSFMILVKNSQYIKLLVGFGIAIGNLNTTTALLAQLPTNNNAAETGFVGFTVILCGFAGAVITGALLSRTRAYETILKSAYTLAVFFYVALMLCCYNDNFSLMAFCGAMTGFFTVSTIPATLQNAVECTYGLREDMSVGLLYIAANVISIPFTFIGQELLAQDTRYGGSDHTAGLFPFAVFAIAFYFVGLGAVLSFEGSNNRLKQDEK